MIKKVSTKDMSREDWLAARQKSIGGSDAASILGLSQYNSAYSLWTEKTGRLVREDISDKEAVRLGNDLEQYVAERFMEATGKKVRRENSILYNDAYPFAHANPDRIVVGEEAGLECKTTSSWDIAQQLREGKIPDYWYCQCTHYMMVTGAKRWYLAALVFGVGFFWQCIERNDAEIQALSNAEERFWSYVTNDTPPAVDGSEATTDALKTIYADAKPGSSIDLTCVGAAVEMYKSLMKQINELDALCEEQINVIKSYMGESEVGTYGSTKVTWKSSTRSTFDKAAYEADNGKIPSNYYKTSNVRRFVIK